MTRTTHQRSGRLLLLTVGLLLTLVFTSPAVAQNEPANFYEISYVQVKSNHWAEYQAAVADLIKVYEKHDYKYALNARAFPDEMVIRYITPLDSMADYAAMDAELERLRKVAGGELDRAMKRYQALSESSRSVVLKSRPDLSYEPDNSYVANGEAMFHQIGFWYIQRDKVAEAEANAKAYAELFRKKGIRMPFSVFESYIGDRPLYVVANPGRSQAEFYAELEKVNAKLGADGVAMNTRALAATRKFVSKDSINMPDLSYVPD